MEADLHLVTSIKDIVAPVSGAFSFLYKQPKNNEIFLYV